MRYWHLTFASANRMTLFPTAESRRVAAVCITRVAGAYVVLFAIVDDHGHVVIVCETAALPIVRSSLTRALSRIVEVPLAASHVQPIETRRHLERVVPYFLTQSTHHGLERSILDPGSCLQDLVGARILPGFDPRLLKSALPRLARKELLAAVKLPATVLEPATPDELRRAGTSGIVAACAEATALPPGLGEPSWRARRARHACVCLHDLASLPRREIAVGLGISPRTVRRLGTRLAPPEIVRAARLRIGIDRSIEALSRGARRVG